MLLYERLQLCYHLGGPWGIVIVVNFHYTGIDLNQKGARLEGLTNPHHHHAIVRFVYKRRVAPIVSLGLYDGVGGVLKVADSRVCCQEKERKKKKMV
jgi:hypothetical protein